MKKIFVAIIVCLFVSSIQAQSYSVKNRWNIKAGYSRYVTNEYYRGTDKLLIGWEFVQKRNSNYRVEVNYGVLPSLEVGLYAGIMVYPTMNVHNPFSKEEYDSILYHKIPVALEVTDGTAIAPMFGLNVNFHILPLFVKKEDCRWDFYVCAKYGGCYLTEQNMTVPYTNIPFTSYKHEYGVGLGGSVYFWNLVGLYTECSLGRYSFFHTSDVPTTINNYFNIRGGLTFKLR